MEEHGQRIDAPVLGTTIAAMIGPEPQARRGAATLSPPSDECPVARSAIGTGSSRSAARRRVDAVEAGLRLGGESVYREHQLPFSLAGSVGCSWEQRAARDSVQLIVPDGCIDLIWLAEHQLVIAGPDTGPRDVLVPAGLWSSGVRLRPGAAGVFLGRPASELRGLQVVAEDVLGSAAQRLTDELAVAGMRERRTSLLDAVRTRAPRPDLLVAAAAVRLAPGGSRVSDVARDLGVSERQLHRRMVSAVGYGPKTLGRVLRLRRLAVPSTASLAERAIAAGYVSQAHMSDEVRRLTGRTPVRFLEYPTLTAA